MISRAAELRPFTFNYINQVITQQKVNILIKNWQSRAAHYTKDMAKWQSEEWSDDVLLKMVFYSLKMPQHGEVWKFCIKHEEFDVIFLQAGIFIE